MTNLLSGLCCCSGVVGELCGLAYGWREDSSVQNDEDVASAETVESFGSLSGHEGNRFHHHFSATSYLALTASHFTSLFQPRSSLFDVSIVLYTRLLLLLREGPSIELLIHFELR